jgi:hypothetical protein
LIESPAALGAAVYSITWTIPPLVGSGRAIEELNEDEWSAGRYLSVMKWSNTAIHPRPNDAVGCKDAQDQDEDVTRRALA